MWISPVDLAGKYISIMDYISLEATVRVKN
jgi:hypothetical protein